MNEHLESDLGAAAYLKVRGFRLLGVMPLGGRRCAFRFDDPEGGAEQASLDYQQGADAPAQQMVEALKALKAILYSQKEKQEYESRNHARVCR